MSRKLSKMIDNSNNMNSRRVNGGGIAGLRERNANSGVSDRDRFSSQICDCLRERFARFPAASYLDGGLRENCKQNRLIKHSISKKGCVYFFCNILEKLKQIDH